MTEPNTEDSLLLLFEEIDRALFLENDAKLTGEFLALADRLVVKLEDESERAGWLLNIEGRREELARLERRTA